MSERNFGIYPKGAPTMRLTIYYNADGSINSISGGGVVPIEKATMPAGEQRIEIDLPHIASNMGSAELVKRITDIADNYVVDVKSGSRGLLKK